MPQVREVHALRHGRNLENQKQKSAFIIKEKLVQECTKRTYPRIGTLGRRPLGEIEDITRENESQTVTSNVERAFVPLNTP